MHLSTLPRIMKATFRISEQDYVEAAKLFAKATLRIVVIRWLLVLGVAAAFFFGDNEVKGIAAGTLFGGMIVVCVARFVVPMMQRWNYRKYKSIQEEFAVELVEDGVRFFSKNGDSKVPWDTVLKWRQNDKWVLIYMMPRMYHMIPTALTTQGFDLQKLTDRLRQHVGEPV